MTEFAVNTGVVAPDASVPDGIAKAAELGVGAVEFFEFDRADPAAVREACDQHDVSVAAVLHSGDAANVDDRDAPAAVNPYDHETVVTALEDALESAAAVEAVAPEVFVCLDAHLDLRRDLDGNEHSHATVTRRILDGGDPAESSDDAAAGVEAAVVLGARTGSPEEWDRAAAADVTVVAPEDVAEFDLRSWLDGRTAYLSVDVDAADPGFAPGTGTPEPFGLEPRVLRDVVRTVAPHAAGFDVVEVNDRDDGQAASLAAKLCREFVYSHAAGRE